MVEAIPFVPVVVKVVTETGPLGEGESVVELVTVDAIPFVPVDVYGVTESEPPGGGGGGEDVYTMQVLLVPQCSKGLPEHPVLQFPEPSCCVEGAFDPQRHWLPCRGQHPLIKLGLGQAGFWKNQIRGG